MTEDLVLRLCSALLAGIILSQTGSLLQLTTRNLLASPSTLGFDGLAIFWILIFHSAFLFLNLEVSVAGLILAGLPLSILIAALYALLMKGKNSIEKLVLMGLTFNLLIGTLFSLWQFLFVAFNLPFPVELWFGHFRFADQTTLLILACFEVLMVCGWFMFRRDMILLTLGQQLSKNLKLDEKKIHFVLFTAIATGTFLVIGLFGAFAFLALIFPLVARKIWFQRLDLKGELWWGSVGNGLFLMIIDLLCYHFPIMGAEIPVGLIATAVGAVSLIAILWKSHMAKELK